jgi:hypothetical protein
VLLFVAACQVGEATSASDFKLSISGGALHLAVNETAQLQVTPSDGAGAPYTGVYTIAWSSSNDAVANVSGKGLLTGAGNGNAVITATARRVDTGATATASLQVAVGTGTNPDMAAPVDMAFAPDMAGTPDMAVSSTRTYTTNFPLTENPISEGGVWHKAGLDWANVATTPGRAFSTQTSNAYDDAYAFLSGFSSRQSGQGVIHLASGYSPPNSHEVEIILRASDAAHEIHWYECNLSWDGGYAQIVRIDGAIGQFQDITQTSVPIKPKNGDVFRCTADGNVITSYLNGVMMSRTVDDTFPSGQPGMAFFIRPGATASSYCFSSFTASNL